MGKKVFYYNDELNDDFSGVTRKTKVIDEKYKYIKRNPVWKLFEFVVYRIFVMPFAFIYIKCKFNHKVVGKEKLKRVKGGYFMYTNHTLMAGDAFIPNVVNFPKKTFTIVHPDNISIVASRPFIEMCGAIPLPATPRATINFMDAIELRSKKCVIQIYPEAHVWPYYTSIRDFKSTSFRYPIKYNRPIFVMTNTFVKKKWGKVPKVISYIDGPFECNKNLPPKEQEDELKERIYSVMLDRAKLSSYKYYEYIKENTND